jgi:hypothetical protein
LALFADDAVLTMRAASSFADIRETTGTWIPSVARRRGFSVLAVLTPHFSPCQLSLTDERTHAGRRPQTYPQQVPKTKTKSHSLASICADALDTMLPSWYATPGNVARNAGGAISARWMGIWDGRVSIHVCVHMEEGKRGRGR